MQETLITASHENCIVTMVGVKLVPLEDAVEQRIRETFPLKKEGLMKTEPGGLLIPPRFADIANDIYSIPVRLDDTWICTFPKSGTTWTQELVWLLMNNLDYGAAKEKLLDERSPFLEDSALVSYRRLAVTKTDRKKYEAPLFTVKDIEYLPSPRIIKTHLPFCCLPELSQCKVIYVARNPKDVLVSYYFHHQFVPDTDVSGGLEAFFDRFIADEVLYAPYWPHVLDAWKRRSQPNFLFLFYEDMIDNLRRESLKVANFLGKPITEPQLDELVAHLRFDRIKENKAVNKEELKILSDGSCRGTFIRKGQIGDWKNYFTISMENRMNQWMEKHLQGTDLRFTTEANDLHRSVSFP